MSGRIFRYGPVELRWNWLIFACVVATMAGLVRLGLWQLDRAQDKIELQQSHTALGNQQAIPLTQVPTAGPEFDRQQHQNRRVVLDGAYRNERSIFLIYQTYEGQPGYEVLTPFRLRNLSLLVLVSRCWSVITAYEDLAQALPHISVSLRVEGQIHVPSERELAQRNLPHETRWPLLLRYPDMNELVTHFDTPLFPYIVRLAEGQPGVLIRHWPAVNADTSQHFSYALQWFAMAIALAIVSLVLSSNLASLIRSRLGPL